MSKLLWVNKAENWIFQTKLRESLPYRIKTKYIYIFNGLIGLITDTRSDSEREKDRHTHRQIWPSRNFCKFLSTNFLYQNRFNICQIMGWRGKICSSVIWDRGLKEKLRLGEEKISGRIFRKAVELEVTKQICWTSIRPQKVNVRELWKGRPPPTRKKRLLTHSNSRE